VTALELLACGALVGCSAFLSASEVAIFSLSRFQLRSLRDRFADAQRRIKKLQSDAGGVLITILILNEVVNISLSTILTGTIDRAFQDQSTPWLVKALVGVLVTTPVLLVLCEITPKAIAARANTIIAPLVAAPLHALYKLMRPLRTGVLRLVGMAGGRRQEPVAEKNAPIREEEFLVMVEEGHREGTIQRNELDLIRNVFAMEETTARELMTPLVKVPVLSESMTIAQAIDQLRQLKTPRIPVLSPDRREIIGIIYLKDLLRARLNPALGGSPISQLMHKPLAVPQRMPVNRLFKRFRQSQTHIAVVLGPAEEPIGIVTLDQILDDLMEEMIHERRP